MIVSYDPSCNTITSSSAESINRAAFILVLPKSKQRVVDAKLLHLARKSRKMGDEWLVMSKKNQGTKTSTHFITHCPNPRLVRFLK